jgi:hypothetical protein
MTGYRSLIGFRWISFVRDERFRKDIAGRVMILFVLLFLAVGFGLLGTMIDRVLRDFGGDPIAQFDSILLWYLAGDLLARCFLQPLPMVDIIPFLRLPIRRRRIAHVVLLMSSWNLFNLFPLFVVVPFAVKILFPIAGPTGAALYLLGWVGFLAVNNLVGTLIQLLMKKNLAWGLLPIDLLAALYLAKLSHLPVTGLGVALGRAMIGGSTFLYLGILAAAGCIFLGCRRLLMNGLYVDGLTLSYNRVYIFSMTGLDQFTKTGEICRDIWLECSLLIRNKRSRQILGYAPLYLAYFCYIVMSNDKNSPFFSFIFLSFIIIMMPSLYGQFIFSWESTFFDGIMARKNCLECYLRSKYYLLVLFLLVSVVPCGIVLVATGRVNIFFYFALSLFDMGVGCCLILLMAVFNDGRVELTRNLLFNYQGVRAGQFGLLALCLFLPASIYFLMKYLVNEGVAQLVLAVTGAVFLVMHQLWIRSVILPLFNRRKYKNMEGFRKISV